MNTKRKDTSDTVGEKKYADFLNYFGKDRWIHQWLAEKRTRLFSSVYPFFRKLGLVPDTFSYTGIALLAGVVLFFVRSPVIAVCFLGGHLICDALDGSYARNAGKASHAGAFTDLVCDQLGMVTVVIMALFHHLVDPLIGAIYVTLYLIVVVFGVLINVMGLGSRLTITSKYFLYIVYAIWAFTGRNYLPQLMGFFSVLMAVEVCIGYLRLKRAIRRKYDAEVRFTQGDPYSSGLNYALNVFIPVAVLLVILVSANTVPIRASLEKPRTKVTWIEGPQLVHDPDVVEIEGLGIDDSRFLVLTRDIDDHRHIVEIPPRKGSAARSFALPEYVRPAFGNLPVDDGMVIAGDTATRLLLGMDLEASFASGRPVIKMTLPMGYLRITALATATWDNKKVWLAGNYLYSRKTYRIDPRTALKTGSLLAGAQGSYVNGAFPAGLLVHGRNVIEFNRSSMNALLYTARIDRLTRGVSLLDVKSNSFPPPVPDALGPVIEGDYLVMVSRQGKIYRLPCNLVLD
ncbi:MAG: CDP-alcohol phosphatidyltransferase family protein [Thermodesulfobacteriota bacterium]